MAVGGIGICQNVITVGSKRTPEAFGIPLKFVGVIAETKVMEALYKVEEKHQVGKSMIPTFFPGGLSQEEKIKWNELIHKDGKVQCVSGCCSSDCWMRLATVRSAESSTDENLVPQAAEAGSGQEGENLDVSSD